MPVDSSLSQFSMEDSLSWYASLDSSIRVCTEMMAFCVAWLLVNSSKGVVII